MKLRPNSFSFLVKFAICFFAATSAQAENFVELSDIVDTEYKGSVLHDVWERAKLNLSVNFLKGSVGLGDNYSLGGGLKYRYVVQPAFLKDLHQRMDVYTLNFNLSGGSSVGIGLNMATQVTFSRLESSKMKAIKAPFYFVNQIPWTSDVAAKELHSGDAVRIEVNSDGSIGKGVDDRYGSMRGHFGIVFTRGSRLIVDVYKLRDSHMRLKMVVSKNNGSMGLSAGLDPFRKWETGIGFIDSQLNRWLNCSPLQISGSSSLTENVPVENVLIDYVFNLKTEQGRELYNQVMHAIKHLHFQRYLNFEHANADLTEELLQYVQAAEQQYRHDFKLPPIERTVDRVFKGKSVSSFVTTAIGSNCRAFWSADLTQYNAKTLVRSFDENESMRDMIYLSTDRRARANAVINLFGEETHSIMNGLFKSDDSKRVGNEFNPVPLGISDWIMSYETRDKNLSTDEIRQVQKRLKHMAPTVASQINWNGFESKDRTNGYINFMFVLHEEAVSLIPKMDRYQIYNSLREYFDGYPGKNSLPSDYTNQQSIIDNPNLDKWEKDLQEIAVDLDFILNHPNPVKRMEYFSALRKMQLFHVIGAGYLINMLPAEEIPHLVFTRVTAGSAENKDSIIFTSGENDLSKIYHSVEYILSVINERNFDLRMQYDEREDSP